MKNYINDLILWIKETKIGKLLVACILFILFGFLANLWFPFIYVCAVLGVGLVSFIFYGIYCAFKNRKEW